MNKPVAGPPAPLDPEAADLADWHRYANDLVDAMVAEPRCPPESARPRHA